MERVRVALLLVRLWVLYRWRRGDLSVRVPSVPEVDHRHAMPQVDTGGAYRAPFRSQFGDSTESHTSPHSEGSNCTMAAAAMALNHHTKGAQNRKGGDMRHHQSDNDSGTDLYDAAEAWAHYGQSLSIRSGQGWGKVVAALNEGRGVILQGTGGLTGCGDYTGGHAIYVAPEKSGSKWLKGDPECSAYEWTEASKLEGFAERLSSGVYFAVTKVQATSSPPTPPAIPCPPATDQDPPGPELDRAYALGVVAGEDAAVGLWVAWIGAPMGGEWDGAGWGPYTPSDLDALDDCGGGVGGGVWGRGPLPDPVAAAITARTTPPTWAGANWTETLW